MKYKIVYRKVNPFQFGKMDKKPPIGFLATKDYLVPCGFGRGFQVQYFDTIKEALDTKKSLQRQYKNLTFKIEVCDD